MTKTEAEQKYLDYIDNHISMVQMVYSELKKVAKNSNVDKYLGGFTDELIKNHDKSKYSNEEFDGYRSKFYPYEGEIIYPVDFHKSWIHHIKNNPHHWEHWVTFKRGEPDPCAMDKEYVIEMLCDWTAMSVKFGNFPSDWWKQNKSNIILKRSTFNLIESYIYMFNHVYERLIDKLEE